MGNTRILTMVKLGIWSSLVSVWLSNEKLLNLARNGHVVVSGSSIVPGRFREQGG